MAKLRTLDRSDLGNATGECGDRIAAAREISYVSTVDGAFLEWLGRHELPAIAAREEAGGAR